MQVIFNPAPAFPLNASIFNSVTVLIVNETEAETLSNVDIDMNSNDDILLGLALNKVALYFIVRGVKIVVVTLGERGAFCRTSDEVLGTLHPARKVNVVDSTGAGDTFVGAFAAMLSNPYIRKKWKTKEDLNSPIAHKVVDFCILASSVAVQKPGAQDSIPWLSEVP
jgi:ribokinase